MTISFQLEDAKDVLLAVSALSFSLVRDSPIHSERPPISIMFNEKAEIMLLTG
ncbi:MAG TPA: hypothetical protein VFZ43_09050 [Anaerolineales bacterium]